MHLLSEQSSYTAMSNKIKVEVAYAKPDQQWLLQVELEKGSTIHDAILHSGILQLCPDIDLKKQKIGIFSKSHQLIDLVNESDRIEIYRPLLIDPKESRRVKARVCLQLIPRLQKEYNRPK